MAGWWKDRVTRLWGALRRRDGHETALWTGIVVFALSLAVAGMLVVAGSGDGGGDQASMTSGQDSGPTGPLDGKGVWDPYVAIIGGGRGAGETAQAQWTPVVRSFVKDFLHASADAQWLTKLAPLVSPQLLQRLHWVQRSQVPTGTPGGITLQTAGDHAVDVTAAYTSGGVEHALGLGLVDLPKDGRGWMVYRYQDRSPGS